MGTIRVFSWDEDQGGLQCHDADGTPVRGWQRPSKAIQQALVDSDLWDLEAKTEDKEKD